MTQFPNPKRTILNPALSFCIVVFAFSIASAVDAAKLSFDPTFSEAGLSQQFAVSLMLDAEGQELNAVEGRVVFPSELLELREIRDGDSIVSLWLDKPSVTGNEISFSGIMPGGFGGVLVPYEKAPEPGKVLSLIFEPKNIGSGNINISQAQVLLNDGLGTPAELSTSAFRFNIGEAGLPGKVRLPEVVDTAPPEEFTPIITRNPDIFSNQWFLVFSAKDRQSGMDKYLISESRRKKERIATNDWVLAESPYLLKDQKLKSYIYIKAVDRAGNERVVTVEPRYPLKWFEKAENWVIIILVIVVGFVIVRRFL